MYRVLPDASAAAGRARERGLGRRRVDGRAAGLAGIGLLGAALVVFAVSLGAGRAAGPGATASTVASIVPSPAATPSAAAVASSSAALTASRSAAPGAASSDPFPNLAETALLATMRLPPASLTGACERGTYAVLSGYDGRSIPLASVACRPEGGMGASTFLIRRFGTYGESGGPADYGVSVITNIAAGKATRADDILPGNCATATRAEGRWEIPTVASGSLRCYVEPDTGDAVFWWTYDGANLIVRTTSQRGDMAALYQFFDRYKGMIVP